MHRHESSSLFRIQYTVTVIEVATVMCGAEIPSCSSNPWFHHPMSHFIEAQKYTHSTDVLMKQGRCRRGCLLERSGCAITSTAPGPLWRRRC